MKKHRAKPFVKWAGGKGQLLEQLQRLLPADFASRRNVTYVEPFVGGGAMLFFMLQQYPNISHAVINDINEDLTKCYKIIRDNPLELIGELGDIQTEFYALKNESEQKEYFLKCRDSFNAKNLDELKNTVLFVFLNRTCFNGLYRVNKRGLFNVPFGKYKFPTICDPETILADSRLLQNTEILTGDFKATGSYIDKDSFFYFDPPYRPLNSTSNFNSYSKEEFDDNSQIALRFFCDKLDHNGANFMLSNSDCSGNGSCDSFFDNLYEKYNINRVWATRNVNADASKRGKLTEILVCNFTHDKDENVILPLSKVKPIKIINDGYAI